MDKKKNNETLNKEGYFDEFKSYVKNSNIKNSSRRSAILSLLLLTLFIASIKVIFSI